MIFKANTVYLFHIPPYLSCSLVYLLSWKLILSFLWGVNHYELRLFRGTYIPHEQQFFVDVFSLFEFVYYRGYILTAIMVSFSRSGRYCTFYLEERIICSYDYVLIILNGWPNDFVTVVSNSSICIRFRIIVISIVIELL